MKMLKLLEEKSVNETVQSLCIWKLKTKLFLTLKNINKDSAKKAESLFIFYSYFNLINLSISSATSFACAAALTTVSAPVATSPEANTPSFVV